LIWFNFSCCAILAEICIWAITIKSKCCEYYE
jgi:hypothetical protein